MIEILTLTEYASKVLAHKNDPHTLADLQIELAVKYAFISEIFKDLQLEKAMFETNVKFAGEKPLSDTAVESKWKITEGGSKEIKAKYELRAIEKLLSAIKSSIVVSSNEARNLQ